MATNGDYWREVAERAGVPPRTLENVKAALVAARASKTDASMARLMLKHGRLTPEAREYVTTYHAD